MSSPASATADSYEDLDPPEPAAERAPARAQAAGAPTTLKRRFVDPSYMRKLFEVYFMNDEPLTGGPAAARSTSRSPKLATKADVVIATDFGHGLIGPSSIDDADLVLALPGGQHPEQQRQPRLQPDHQVSQADYVCIDAPEARLALSDRVSGIGDIARRLARDGHVDCPKIIVTQGKHGCVTYRARRRGSHDPGVRQERRRHGRRRRRVPCGHRAAGRGRRRRCERVGFIGNVVGALKVEIVGHRRSIDKSALIKGITGLLK